MRILSVVPVFVALILAGCGTQPVAPSTGHIKDKPKTAGTIPEPVQKTVTLPPPRPVPKVETYSVVVNNVPVQELLFALARDAKVNVDLHAGIEGSVTLNALDQTLPQLLTRIAKQVDMRYELDGPNLAVMPDTPYLRNYKIDYVNISRDSSSTISIATQVSTTGAGGAAGGAAGNNNSTTSVTNTTNNRLWITLIQNIKDMLRETDKVLPEGSSETVTEHSGSESTTGTGAEAPPPARNKATNGSPLAGSPNPATLQAAGTLTTRRTTFREAASVIPNPETGIIAVRATSRQHEKIQEFLDQVLSSAKRQVLIEATVVEVILNDQYQSGIDWKRIAFGAGLSARQNFAGTDLSNVANPMPDMTRAGQISSIMGDSNLDAAMKYNLIQQIAPGFSMAGLDPSTGLPAIQGIPGGKLPYSDTAFTSNGSGLTIGYSNAGSIAAAIKLLNTFGNVKVLSSPKISALNNQTALLKVVDNKVYFTVNVQMTPATATSAGTTTYQTTVNTVPVGFLMTVTPQVDENDMVTLNVRPTVSRIIRYVNDPNPALAQAGTVSPIPEIQVREMESIIKVFNGHTAIMGGLMQDVVSKSTDGVPGISKVPIIGDAFSNRNDTTTKSELVIFMRPVVVKEASMDGDYKDYRNFLPDERFLSDRRDAASLRIRPMEVSEP